MSQELVDTFYGGLARSDGDAMAACYAPDIVFSDPGFGELRGRDAGDMWRMLCSGATDLRASHTIVEVDADRAVVDWVADYTFSATNRPVHNEIRATMRFRDGLIVEHRDVFDFWKWSGQALGLPGRLLGWSPPFRNKVQSTTAKMLRRYQERNGT